jgi:HD-like signal output (HDOD) protein
MTPTIDCIIETIDLLKPVSDVAAKVMALLNDPDCGMSDLAEIIRYEPALTANVLKLANSAYFGLPGKISDAKQAIVYLGMTQVVDLVLLVTCSNRFSGSHHGYGLSKGDLWRSAVAGGVMAGDLAKIKGMKQGSLLFTSGLLRDIGKVVMDQHVQTAMDQIQDRIATQAVTFIEAERLVLGFDHSEVGAMVAQKWQFPPMLQQVIRHHHTPLQSNGCFLEASVVHLADLLCRKMGISRGFDDPTYPEDERVLQSLALNESVIQQVMDGFSAKMSRLEALFAVN